MAQTSSLTEKLLSNDSCLVVRSKRTIFLSVLPLVDFSMLWELAIQPYAYGDIYGQHYLELRSKPKQTNEQKCKGHELEEARVMGSRK